jgi:glucose-1-phosphate adenylyltransferase
MLTAISMIFAGGRVEELSVLTESRPKSAVVFGGIYRTIDFSLTNLIRAGISKVGILTQYRPSTLMDHVGTGLAWDLIGPSRGVRFLPPYLGKEGGGEGYRGPADALFQNIDFIESSGARDVLVVSGDHVYAMNYNELLSFHREVDADLTMAFVPREDASRFGIGEINATGQIINFAEKPTLPRTNLCFMSIYAIKREILVEELLRSVETGEEGRTFQIHEVLRRMIPRRRAYGYIHSGRWEYVRTLDEYFRFHQLILGIQPKIDLASWKIRTNPMSNNIVDQREALPPPTRILPGAHINNSLVSAGCIIEGKVTNSTISPGVRVCPGASAVDCILWDDVVVEEGAHLIGVISDKRARFGKGCQVGSGQLMVSEEMPNSLTCGATLIGMDACIPYEAKIGKNCIVHPKTQESDFPGEITSGKSIWPARKAVRL